VASQNLGEGAGLLAAAALMIDYVLTAAVGISAGVGALISAVPSLQPHTLALVPDRAGDSDHREHARRARHGRGVHDSHLSVHGNAADRDRGGGGRWCMRGHPQPVTPLPAIPRRRGGQLVAAAEGLFFGLHGDDRRGGGEQRRDGLPRPDTRKNAKDHADHHHRAAGVLLLGIALLCRAYGIAATDPGGPGYESVLSMLTRAVMGHGWFYYVTIALGAAGAGSLGQHGVCRFSAADARHCAGQLHAARFLLRGRRLLYSWGIYVLVALTALLLIVFGGVTDRLIPLYAIGAFMAFTLSQAGMVMHWKRQGKRAGAHVCERAGRGGHGHYDGGGAGGQVCRGRVDHGAAGSGDDRVDARRESPLRAREPEIDLDRPIVPAEVREPIVVVPIDRWSRISEKALSFALSMSSDIRCVHVQTVRGARSVLRCVG
jgi:hypothetical protein